MTIEQPEWETYMDRPSGGDGGAWRAWSRYSQDLRRRAGTPELRSTLSPRHWAQLGQTVGETGAGPAATGVGGDWMSILASLGLTGSRGSSGGAKADTYDTIRKRQEDAASDRAQSVLRDWYARGGHMERFGGLESALSQIGAGSREAAQGEYQRTLQNILGGYQGAGQMMDTGYRSVRDFLAANQPQAYAGFQADPGMAAQASMNYLDAYGVDAAPVQAQVAAEQSALQGGAGAFNSLVDVLNRASQQAGQSRMTELELAQNLGRQSLGQQRASYESQAASAYQRALMEIAAEEARRRYELEEAKGTASEEPWRAGIPVSDDPAAPRVVPRTEKIQTAVANNTTLKGAVRETNPGFFQKNPNPTKAQLEKAFPAVAKAFKESKGR
jgi:hypothetical protein